MESTSMSFREGAAAAASTDLVEGEEEGNVGDFQGPSVEPRVPMAVLEKWQDPSLSAEGNCWSRAWTKFHSKLRARMRSPFILRRLPADLFSVGLFILFDVAGYIAGFVEYITVAENTTGQGEYLAFVNGQSVVGLVVGIFSIFELLTINLISRSDEAEGENVKNLRIGKAFRASMMLAVVAVLAGCIIILPFINQWFALRDKADLADTARPYVIIKTFLLFFTYTFGVLVGLFSGCSKLVSVLTFVATGIIASGVLGSQLPKHMDPLQAAAIAGQALQIVGALVGIILVLTPSFRQQYGIFRWVSSKDVPLKGDVHVLKFFLILVGKNMLVAVVQYYNTNASASVSELEQLSQTYASTFTSCISNVIGFGATYQNMVGSRVAIRSRYKSYRFVVFLAVSCTIVFALVGVGAGYGGAWNTMGDKVLPKLPPVVVDIVVVNAEQLRGWLYAQVVLSGVSSVFQTCFVNFQYYWFYSISNFCFDVVFLLGGTLLSQHAFEGDYVALSAAQLFFSLGIVPMVRSLISCVFYASAFFFWLLPRVKKGDEEYCRRKKTDAFLGEPLLDKQPASHDAAGADA